MPDLEPVVRPNGKLYRPRKICCYPVTDEDDSVIAVVVLGTHDIERAWPLAEDCVHRWVDSSCVAAGPSTGWFLTGFSYGELRWLEDAARGRAGVWFEVADG